jgi:GNAT superfamily N-acetyltransferase
VEGLFGQRGACGGCWCQSWRLSRAQFRQQKGEGNRAELRRLIESGTEPGILAYYRDEPIGWCAIAPRQEYVALQRSRVLAPIDDKPVWSVSCLFVAKGYRNRGVSVALLRAAVEFAKVHGARIVEGYPQDLGSEKLPDAFVWTGLKQAFIKAGFKEAAKRSPKRPIMRKKTGT